MTVQTGLKAQAAHVKSVGADEGTFEAIVAVFNNIDSYGDVILKGAFADTLDEWAGSGYPIPVVWSHDKDDPFSHIGHVTEAKETDTGLLVKGALDLENPKAAQVHRLLKGGRVKEFSFAFSYSPEDVNPAKREGVEVRELKRLKLYEVGPTLVGANPATQLLSVKSAGEPTEDLEAKTDEEGGADEEGEEQEGDGQDDARAAYDQVSDLIDRLATAVSDAYGILERLDGMIGRESGDSGSGDASRSQPPGDEAQQGKSSEGGSADRSAEEQKNLAALWAAILQEDSDESEGTAR